MNIRVTLKCERRVTSKTDQPFYLALIPSCLAVLKMKIRVALNVSKPSVIKDSTLVLQLSLEKCWPEVVLEGK